MVKFYKVMVAIMLMFSLATSGLTAGLSTVSAQTPVPQRQGLFGTVTAVGTDSITLSTAQGAVVVKVDASTKFFMPGRDNLALKDIQVGNRLAMLVLKSDSGLLALAVLVVPGQPVTRHVVGVVTAVTPTSVTITYRDGNVVTVNMNSAGIAVGDMITVIVRPDQTGKLLGQALEKLENVSKRLADNVQRLEKEDSRGHKADIDNLRGLLDKDVTIRLSALQEAEHSAPASAQAKIKDAFDKASRDEDDRLRALGLGPHKLEMKGVITAIDATAGTITIQGARGAGAVTLKVTASSRIHKDDKENASLSDIKVGDIVLAVRYGAQTKEIIRVEIKSPAVATASGILAMVDVAKGAISVLTEKMRQPLVLSVNASSQIMKDGAAVTLDKLAVGDIVQSVQYNEGSLAVASLTVLSPVKAAGMTVNFIGNIDSFSVAQIVVAGRVLAVNAQTKFEGIERVGASARVQAQVQADGSLLAVLVNVSNPLGSSEAQEQRRDEGQRVEFEGAIETVATGQIAVSGKTVVIDSQTKVRGTLRVGAIADVSGSYQADGSILAKEVNIEGQASVLTPAASGQANDSKGKAPESDANRGRADK